MTIMHFCSLRVSATASWHVLITSALARTKTLARNALAPPFRVPLTHQKASSEPSVGLPGRLRREVTATWCQGCNQREQHEPESEAGTSEP